MPLGSVGIYPQLALIGNPFANCAGNTPITVTFDGSATVTDNWSVETNGTFSVPSNSLSVSTTVGSSQATTLKQIVSTAISPGMQMALVGITEFNGTSGDMVMQYHNGTTVKVPRTVYFRNTGEYILFELRDLPCGETWPAWNSTPELVIPNNTVRAGGYRSQGLCILSLVISILVNY
ncbi:hypothetical protein BDV93DRAFT_527165 [Ceratobasidium sp. AG-I]|nr:hypothetical protein BDV93DRAFT_527165 [Ceratobasidium sp. AG-I]